MNSIAQGSKLRLLLGMFVHVPCATMARPKLILPPRLFPKWTNAPEFE